MSKPALLLFVVFLIGCEAKVQMHVDGRPSKQVATNTAVKPEPTEADKIALLRAEAHKRGLRWHIYCVSGHQWNFQAAANHVEEPKWAVYIEDGAKPYWIATGMTQADAAYALYFDIQGAEKYQPDHRPGEDDHKKICPPELRGQ